MLPFTLVLGLVLLLAGMRIMRTGLQTFAGKRLRQALAWMTATPWRGLWSGTIASALMQSSTALTVMTVSLVDAGLLPLSRSLGLILGGNVGTTVTAQLMALPLGSVAIYAMLGGALGFLCLGGPKRHLALAISGLGLLFWGLAMFQSALTPLAAHPQIQAFLRQLGDHHLQGVLAGTLMAAILHSSAATTGIVMLLLGNGWLTMPTALAFIFGANIGTCITAILVSFTARTAAQKVAVFHALLNIFGVLLFYPFLHPIANLLSGLGGSLARQAANAHTLFNLVSSLLVFPFLPYITRWLGRGDRP